jgi:hypothetical protein
VSVAQFTLSLLNGYLDHFQFDYYFFFTIFSSAAMKFLNVHPAAVSLRIGAQGEDFWV